MFSVDQMMLFKSTEEILRKVQHFRELRQKPLEIYTLHHTSPANHLLFHRVLSYSP